MGYEDKIVDQEEGLLTIQFGLIGKNLSARFSGAECRGEIMPELTKGRKVICNFNGVESVSNAFADECFGKLLNTFESSTIRDLIIYKETIPFVRYNITQAIMERIRENAEKP